MQSNAIGRDSAELQCVTHLKKSTRGVSPGLPMGCPQIVIVAPWK